MSAGRLRGRAGLGAALSAVLLASLAGACRREAQPEPDAVARIGGEEIRYGRFAAFLSRADGDTDVPLGGEALSALFDQFLDEQLLARLAADRGLTAAADREREPRRAVDALLAADRQGARAGGAGSPSRASDAEIAAYYAAHRGDFARPERVRLRQILVEDRATADRVHGQIAAGADFAAVARRLAREPRGGGSGSVGGGGPAGDLGGAVGIELSRADLPPTYADTLFALKPGEVSRVIPAPYGFHLFQVVEHLPAEVLPIAQVEEEIGVRLARQRADRRLAALVGECRKRYNVEVYARNLPFDYEGTYREPTARTHR